MELTRHLLKSSLRAIGNVAMAQCLQPPEPGLTLPIARSSMSNIDQSKVNRAIHDCLQHCDVDPVNLLPRIAEFLEGLRAAGGWSDAEIRSVESGVRRVLIFGAPGDATFPGDATDKPIGDGPPDGSKAPKTNGA